MYKNFEAQISISIFFIFSKSVKGLLNHTVKQNMGQKYMNLDVLITMSN